MRSVQKARSIASGRLLPVVKADPRVCFIANHAVPMPERCVPFLLSFSGHLWSGRGKSIAIGDR
ncbi:MAG: hypothetical protein CMJ83_15955 [Planctomycetes bacterium]|jgi:hypothetical protein|nr:hypothetical protein [Planctomycetota bacterium]